MDFSNLQNDLTSQTAKVTELTGSVAGLKTELESARGQHEDYKVKAKKVLFEKEKLIGSLKERKAKVRVNSEDHEGEGEENGDDEDPELLQAM